MNRLAVALSSLSLCAAAAFAQSAPPASDIYHVHFVKAALGQAKALENQLKKPDPKAPMPGHLLVLKHQDGDDWDYAVIEHLGKKVTLDPADYSAPPSTAPATGAWHTDTFAVGPAWEEFAKQMGLSGDSKAGVYVVATWRAAPGHRQQLSTALSGRDSNSKVQIGSVILAHIEGGPWNFMTLERFASWQDYATDEAASENSQGWYDIRDHGAWHHDTITTRVATAGK